MSSSITQYDAIVIGSGMGGLTAAALLAKAEGKRVLVLEKHYEPGGFTHTFTRKGFRWDVGVHYVGRMNPGSLQRDIMDYISDKKLDWEKIPSPFEQFISPLGKFDVSTDEKEYRRDLIKTFPEHESEINAYFKKIKQGANWFRLNFLADNLPKSLAKILNGLKRFLDVDPHKTTMETLEEIITSDELRVLLTSQWGDYGVPPQESSFIMHATLVDHFIKGGWFPQGGSEEIYNTIAPIITQNGGEILTRHEVTEIVMENNRVTGVVATHKGETKQFSAPVIVNNSGAYHLYRNLLPTGIAPENFEKVEKLAPAAGAIMVYLGLKESPEKLGLHGQNMWINSDGKEHTFAEYTKALVEDKQPLACYVSFPSMRAGETEKHTGTVISMVDYDSFKEWSEQTCMKRDDAYKQLKADIAEGMLTVAEKHLPGLRDMIEYVEVGTPLSIEHFGNKRSGSAYGFKTDTTYFPHNVFPSKTEVEGLFQAGMEVCSPGLVASLMGGVAAAGNATSPLGFITMIAKARIRGHMGRLLKK